MRIRILAVVAGAILLGVLATLTPAERPVPPAAPAIEAQNVSLAPLEIVQAPVRPHDAAAPAAPRLSGRRGHNFRRAGERLSPEALRIAQKVFDRCRDQIAASGDSFRYDGPSYAASFDPQGVTFAPPAGADPASMRLRFDRLVCGGETLAAGGPASPTVDADSRSVVYDRGGVREKYVLRPDGLEQVFVVDRLPAERDDLNVRVGLETSAAAPAPGTLGRSLSLTRAGAEVFTISEAAVFDAAGRRLDLDLLADASGFVLQIPAPWVEAATLPITIDPLLGSEITVDSDINWGMMERPFDVAYNSGANEWMVVYGEGFASGECDVMGQRVSGSGALVGTQFGIDTWVDQTPFEIGIDWSPTASQYLVVYALDPTNDFDESDMYIAGQRLNATGAFVGSRMSIIDGPTYDWFPDVAWGNGSWLVVCQSYNGTDWDVVARSVSTTGTLGTQFTLDGDGDDATRPAVAFNSANTTFLTAWEKGTWDSWSFLTSPANIVARISTASSAGPGTTTVASGGDNWYPHVTAGGDPATEWLVCWQRSAATFDILAQRVGSSGSLAGSQITVQGGDANNQRWPRSTWSSVNKEWFVAWDDATGAGLPDIYANRVSATGTVVSPTKYQITFDPTDESPTVIPAVASNVNSVLSVWLFGTGPYQIHARRFSLDYMPPSAPSAISPISPPATGDSTPVLTWTAASDQGGSGVVRYDWEISTDPSFMPLFASGSTAATSDVVTIVLPDDTYYWHVQAIDGADNIGAWSTTVSFTVDTSLNAPPSIVDTSQVKMDKATLIPVGGTSNQIEVVARAALDDPEDDDVRLEVEVRPVGTAFTNLPTHVTPFGSDGTIHNTAMRLVEGSYHWQYRATDVGGHLTAWMPFGANPEPAATDFQIFFGGHSGRSAACSMGAPPAPAGGPLWAAMSTLLVLLGARAFRRR